MTRQEIKLWRQMAEHTFSKCKKMCKTGLGSCCSREYCDMARETARSHGEDLKETGNERLPFLGEDGCVVPFHFRQLCTLHQCLIENLGFDPNDRAWTKRYFELRKQLEELSFDEGEEQR